MVCDRRWPTIKADSQGGGLVCIRKIGRRISFPNRIETGLIRCCLLIDLPERTTQQLPSSSFINRSSDRNMCFANPQCLGGVYGLDEAARRFSLLILAK